MDEIKVDSLVRSKRRSIGLEVTHEAKLIIRAPKYASLKDIERVISEKKNWILRKQEEVRQKRQTIVEKNFIAGEEFLFLGALYRLNIVENTAIPFGFEQGFYLAENYLHRAKDLFVDWYSQQAVKIIGERAERYSHLTGLYYKQLKISNAKTLWGSCSPKGSVNFTWRLILAPPDVIDYVIIHELVHLQHHNHSERFWTKVKAIIPEYRDKERWLSDNSHLLQL